MKVQACKASAFDIQIRIPSWEKGATLSVNGVAVTAAEAGQYAKIERQWQAGDEIVLNMPMDIQFVEGHPRIEEVRNQVAIKRGPLVYCIETPDIPEKSGILDVYIGSDSALKANYRDDFLGDMTTISADLLVRKDSTNEMYNKVVKPQWDAIRTEFVPYYAWSNRGTAEMTICLPIIWK